MPHATLAPISVISYTRDYVIEFVRYITGWSERAEVSNKTQLQYICSYLESDHIGCKTLVVESDYIDRHYLEDYAEYYARCFPSHPRKCSRLHFFSSEFDEVLFNQMLSGEDGDLASLLQSSYLGFAVIRPIPHTVLARVCLVPYPALIKDPAKKLLMRDVPVNLVGRRLTVNTIPFIEQDKVVSACATSALWVALSARPDMALSSLPSPSNITKSANVGDADSRRIFPTTGLSVPQILRGLRSFGLEPAIVWQAQQSQEDLKAQVYGHISHGSTVILGGAIFEQHGGKWVELGSHLVTVTGFGLRDGAVATSNAPKRISDKLNKFYVHDDRSGPYLRMDAELLEFEVADGSPNKKGYQMNLLDKPVEMFVPSMAIVGLYHKVRIPYNPIWIACSGLHEYISLTHADYEEALRSGASADFVNIFKALVPAFKGYLDAVWDITLTSSDLVKAELVASSDFLNVNGVTNKSALLTKNMPRYIWRCRLSPNESIPQKLTDLLFDATEIPQGNIFIGYIAYSDDAAIAWNAVDDNIRQRTWQQLAIGKEKQAAIGCFNKFFGKDANNSYLNTRYGPLGLPRRSLKPGETDDLNNVAIRGDIVTVREPGVDAWKFLDPNKKYIWVISESGSIVVGEDIAEKDSFKGHPTLLDGRPGRVAGELFNTGSHWELNLKSRAYSGHVAANDRAKYLEAVISSNLVGLVVRPEADLPSPQAVALLPALAPADPAPAA
jgi:hypothetical protein